MDGVRWRARRQRCFTVGITNAGFRCPAANFLGKTAPYVDSRSLPTCAEAGAEASGAG